MGINGSEEEETAVGSMMAPSSNSHTTEPNGVDFKREQGEELKVVGTTKEVESSTRTITATTISMNSNSNSSSAHSGASKRATATTSRHDDADEEIKRRARRGRSPRQVATATLTAVDSTSTRKESPKRIVSAVKPPSEPAPIVRTRKQKPHAHSHPSDKTPKKREASKEQFRGRSPPRPASARTLTQEDGHSSFNGHSSFHLEPSPIVRTREKSPFRHTVPEPTSNASERQNDENVRSKVMSQSLSPAREDSLRLFNEFVLQEPDSAALSCSFSVFSASSTSGMDFASLASADKRNNSSTAVSASTVPEPPPLTTNSSQTFRSKQHTSASRASSHARILRTARKSKGLSNNSNNGNDPQPTMYVRSLSPVRKSPLRHTVPEPTTGTCTSASNDNSSEQQQNDNNLRSSQSLSPKREDSLRRFNEFVLQEPDSPALSSSFSAFSASCTSMDFASLASPPSPDKQRNNSSKATIPEPPPLTTASNSQTFRAKSSSMEGPRRMKHKSASPSSSHARIRRTARKSKGLSNNSNGNGNEQSAMYVRSLSPVRRRRFQGYAPNNDSKSTIQSQSGVFSIDGSSHSTGMDSAAFSVNSSAAFSVNSSATASSGSRRGLRNRSVSPTAAAPRMPSTRRMKTTGGLRNGNQSSYHEKLKAFGVSSSVTPGAMRGGGNNNNNNNNMDNNNNSRTRSPTRGLSPTGLRNSHATIESKRRLFGGASARMDVSTLSMGLDSLDGNNNDDDDVDLEKGKNALSMAPEGKMRPVGPRNLKQQPATNYDPALQKSRKGLRQPRGAQYQLPPQLESAPGAHRYSPVPFGKEDNFEDESGLAAMESARSLSSAKEPSIRKVQTIDLPAGNKDGSYRKLQTVQARDSVRDAGLVEARLVEDSESEHLPVAFDADEYVPPSEEVVAARKMNRMVLLANGLGCFCLILTIVSFVAMHIAGVFRSPIEVTLSPSWAPSTMPSPAPTPYLIPLPEETGQTILANPQSPQAKAYQWLKDDTQLEIYSPYRQLQRFVLVTFYYATNGQGWDINENWLSHDLHECLWKTKGVGLQGDGINQLCDPDGNFLYLYLTKNGLSGRLPPELGLLTKLEVLNVATNSIRGTIPSQIGLMTSLKELLMDYNELTGEVPTEIGELTRLEYFYVHTNPVTGTIMTEVGLLTNMIDFEWTDTVTRGTIPTELGLMTQTTVLFMWANLLEGTIPSEIGSMTNMTYGFGLYGQSLIGTIPTEIGRMTDLESLYLDANFLSGQIPSELGRFHKATEMYLKANDLRGAIPSTFGLLTSLVVLDLSSTSISGSIPSELGALTTVSWINLDATNLAGDVPAELGNLGMNGECEKLKLNDTLVTGEIPSGLCDISDLSFDCSDDLCGCDCVCHFGAQGSVDASARHSESEEDETVNAP
ncbi:Leucine Rich Repeat [Seminavis robusta]|uniref:Leucine Rich Repeat n=1 Tax=Seminavis robusta TaxID=568900 RepID=A0A9N8DJR5_9STRA|nr:Leucine Rich Repeat [Seminavis robusta]|eukprot:Sro181_g079140.1 Leucine Rich Repeat (1397) ;mRNA; f:65694-69884